MKVKPFLVGTIIGLLTLLIGLNMFLFQKIKEQGFKNQTQVQGSQTEQGSKGQNKTKNQIVTIAAVGDLGLGREINWQINQKSDANFPYEKIKTIIEKADLAIANLESPVVNNCPLTRTGMKFCGNPGNIKGLASAGFDLVNLANNHIANYGQEGVETTKETLAENQIDFFGLGEIAFRVVNGLTLAFLGFDDVTSRIDDHQMINNIELAKLEADFVIINFHWGAEYQNQPSQRQKNLAKTAINFGADLIIGHHPHVLQPIEKYQNKLIIYSLGNFIFDQMWSPETRIGAIALISINSDKTTTLEIIPTRIFNASTAEPISLPEKQNIIDQLIDF